MTSMEYLLNCKKFISLMILFSFFDNFGMDDNTKSKNSDMNFFNFNKERNAKTSKFKVGFVGTSGVGKTSIVSRFCNVLFNEQPQPSFGINVYKNTFEIEGKDILLYFWDISGQDSYFSFVTRSYDIFDLIVFVYAVDIKDSFLKVDEFF